MLRIFFIIEIQHTFIETATFGLRPIKTCDQPQFFTGGSNPNYLPQFQRDASINPVFIDKGILVANIAQNRFPAM